MDTTTRTTAPAAPTDPAVTEVLGWLDGCAHQLVALVDGLDETALRARPLPSGWSPLGLLGHVRDSTVFWLHHVLLGHPVAFDDGDDVWDDDPAAWWPEGAWGGYRQDTVLGVLLHLLADNTAHAGHLAVVRELTDGGVWDLSVGAVRRPTG